MTASSLIPIAATAAASSSSSFDFFDPRHGAAPPAAESQRWRSSLRVEGDGDGGVAGPAVELLLLLLRRLRRRREPRGGVVVFAAASSLLLLCRHRECSFSLFFQFLSNSFFSRLRAPDVSVSVLFSTRRGQNTVASRL